MNSRNKKNIWLEAFSWLSRGEITKIILATLNNIQRSYKLIIYYLWHLSLLSMSFFFASEIIHFSESTTYLNRLFFIAITGRILQHYTLAAATSQERKDNLYFSKVNWYIVGCCAVQAALSLFLHGWLFLSAPTLMLVTFWISIAAFFIHDFPSSSKTIVKCFMKSSKLALYFFPFIVITVPLISALTLMAGTVSLYLLLGLLCIVNIISPSSLLQLSTLEQVMLFIILYFVTPFLISFASVLHTKVKYSYFSLFYHNEHS